MRVRIKITRNRRKLEVVRKQSNWFAVGAMAAISAGGGGTALLKAQPPAQSQSQAAVRFSIAPGPLADAITEFQRAAGWKVELPDAGMGTLPSKGVSGILSANEQ